MSKNSQHICVVDLLPAVCLDSSSHLPIIPPHLIPGPLLYPIHNSSKFVLGKLSSMSLSFECFLSGNLDRFSPRG